MLPAPTSGLTLHIRRTDDGALVQCCGMLVAGVADLLYSEAKPLTSESRRVVLDFTELTHIDSMGIGTLVRLYVTAKSAGCELQFINLGRRIRELLGVTHLLSVFSVVGEQGIKLP